MFEKSFTVEEANSMGSDLFPGLVGLRFTRVGKGEIDGEFTVSPRLMAPNGYLHAGSVVTLADTCCGYGVRTCQPDGATGFTTIELKTNFLGTSKGGKVRCQARMVHGGRTTQVWDAVITRDDGRKIALFRATQMLLYPS